MPTLRDATDGSWYAAMGFHSTGRRFTEAGIPHVEMVRLEHEVNEG